MSLLADGRAAKGHILHPAKPHSLNQEVRVCAGADIIVYYGQIAPYTAHECGRASAEIAEKLEVLLYLS